MMISAKPFAFSAAIACALSGQSAIAEIDEPILVTTNPAAVALQLRELGYKAKLTKHNDRPIIESGTSGYFFDIRFFGCDDDIDCRSILFTTSFNLHAGMAQEDINFWNSDRLVGRAFLDDVCDPVIDYYVRSDPKMTVTAFQGVMDFWDFAINDFVDFIGYHDQTEGAAVVDCGAPSSEAL